MSLRSSKVRHSHLVRDHKDDDDGGGTAGRRKIPQHLDIAEWLRILELEQYARSFEGFGGVEDLLGHSEADIKSLGVKIASHRARIMSSLTALKAKYNKNGKDRKAVARDFPKFQVKIFGLQ